MHVLTVYITDLLLLFNFSNALTVPEFVYATADQKIHDVI